MFAQEFGEELFMNGGVAVAEKGEFAIVVVHAYDLMAEFGEASRGDQADVAGTDDSNVQEHLTSLASKILAGAGTFQL